MMLLAVAPEAKIQLLELPDEIADGEVISFEGVEPVDFGGGVVGGGAPMLKSKNAVKVCQSWVSQQRERGGVRLW